MASTSGVGTSIATGVTSAAAGAAATTGVRLYGVGRTVPDVAGAFFAAAGLTGVVFAAAGLTGVVFAGVVFGASGTLVVGLSGVRTPTGTARPGAAVGATLVGGGSLTSPSRPALRVVRG